MVYGYLTKIQKFSVHDGPGIRTTIFLKGCPLECMWCQNPETIRAKPDVTFDTNRCIQCAKCIEVCPQHCFTQPNGKLHFNSLTCDQCGLCVEHCPVEALKWTAEKWATEDLILKVLEDKAYYDCSGGGLTLSGGEPMQQIDFACDMAKRAKGHGIHVTIDTAAYVPYKSFEKILPYADLFLYDLKFIDESLHQKYIGKSNKLILENFKRLCQTDKAIFVRIPCIPNVTETEENLKQIETFARQCRSDIPINRIPWNPFMAEKYEMIGLKSFLHRNQEPGYDLLHTLALPVAFNRKSA